MADLGETIGGINVQITATVAPGETQKAVAQIKQEAQAQLNAQPVQMKVATSAAGGGAAAMPINGSFANAGSVQPYNVAFASPNTGAGIMSNGAMPYELQARASVAAFRSAETEKTRIVLGEMRQRGDMAVQESRRVLNAVGAGQEGSGSFGGSFFARGFGRMASAGFIAREAFQVMEMRSEFGASMVRADSDPSKELEAILSHRKELKGVGFGVVGTVASWLNNLREGEMIFDDGEEDIATIQRDAARTDRKTKEIEKKNAFAAHMRASLPALRLHAANVGVDPLTGQVNTANENMRAFNEFAENPLARDNFNRLLPDVQAGLSATKQGTTTEKMLIGEQRQLLMDRIKGEQKIAEISIDAIKARRRMDDEGSLTIERKAGRSKMELQQKMLLGNELNLSRREAMRRMFRSELGEFDEESSLQVDELHRHQAATFTRAGGGVRSSLMRVNRNFFGAQMSDFDTETEAGMIEQPAWKKPLFAIQRFFQRAAMGAEHNFQIGQGREMLSARFAAAAIEGDFSQPVGIQQERARIIMERAGMKADLANSDPELRADLLKTQFRELTTQRDNLSRVGNDGFAAIWTGRTAIGDPLQSMPGTLRKKALTDELNTSIGDLSKEGKNTPPSGWWGQVLTALMKIASQGNQAPQLP